MILFVDDEKRRMISYVEDLEWSGHKVKFKSDVDSALEAFEQYQDQIEVLILDIMMPTGESFSDNQTNNGLRTGVSFYTKIREHNTTLPIIILTNVSDARLAKSIAQDSKSSFCQKENFLPFELTEKVKEILNAES